MRKAICSVCGHTLDVHKIDETTISVSPCTKCIANAIDVSKGNLTRISGVYRIKEGVNAEQSMDSLKNEVQWWADCGEVKLHSLVITNGENGDAAPHLLIDTYSEDKSRVKQFGLNLIFKGWDIKYVWYMGKYVGND
jgi:hypothetical protein